MDQLQPQQASDKPLHIAAHMWGSRGGGRGVHMSHVEIKKMPFSHVFVTRKWLYSMSIIRNSHVACRYNFYVSWHVTKAPCSVPIASVTMLILGVYTLGS